MEEAVGQFLSALISLIIIPYISGILTGLLVGYLVFSGKADSYKNKKNP